jgi:chromosome segregation ATPase
MEDKNSTSTPTVESLQQELQDSLKSLAENQTLIEQLTTKNVDAQAALEHELAFRRTKEKEVADLLEENSQLKETVASLEKELEATEKKVPAPARPQFKVGDDTYELLVNAVSVPGYGKRTAAEVVVDTEVREALVKMKSGVIRQVF